MLINKLDILETLTEQLNAKPKKESKAALIASWEELNDIITLELESGEYKQFEGEGHNALKQQLQLAYEGFSAAQSAQIDKQGQTLHKVLVLIRKQTEDAILAELSDEDSTKIDKLISATKPKSFSVLGLFKRKEKAPEAAEAAQSAADEISKDWVEVEAPNSNKALTIVLDPH